MAARFGAWAKPALTPSGLPAYGADETAYATAHNVDLREGSAKPADYKGGTAYLTSHRIVWVDAARPPVRPLALDLALVKKQEHETSWVASDKMVYSLLAPAKDGGRKFVLAFKGKGDKEFAKHGEKALARKKWLDAARAKQREAQEREANEAMLRKRGGGIGYLLKKREAEQNRQAAVGQEAFGGDLSDLMEKAKDIVRLTERFSEAKRAEQRRSRSASGGGGGGGGGDGKAGGDDDEDFAEILSTMGIANPVTKKVAGAQYHRELARQLADFLNTDQLLRRPRGGGVMPLTDVYCVYNTARGTSLISPDDLYQACALMGRLRLGMSLKRFESGVEVVQLDGQSDEARDAALAALARERYGDGAGPHTGGIAATDVLAKLGGSLPVARAQLEAAEARGALCRDESVEDGIVFYPNLFADAATKK